MHAKGGQVTCAELLESSATSVVAQRLFDGLKRLEYRGYDSAGICTIEDGELERRRAEGKLDNLARELAAEPLGGDVGIAHTRWATHGAPTVDNAHPHIVGPVALVHNGIIENFKPLRDELIADGRKFKSETDTRGRRPSRRSRGRGRRIAAGRRRDRAAAACRAPSPSPSCSAIIPT